MSRFAHAIYSDDIRHEVGNKRSIVGIYSGTLFVPAFPALLPKLCISVSVVTPSSKPFKSMKVRILVDDSVFAEYPVDEQQFIQQQADSVVSEDPDRPRVNEIHLALQISPFPIEKAILLRTRIVTEEEELKAGGLSIELTPSTVQ